MVEKYPPEPWESCMDGAFLLPGAVKKIRKMDIFLLAAALLGFYFLFFHHLSTRDFWSSHEARAAMDANSLLQDGGIFPKILDGREELQKPPLYYWFVAAISWLRGGETDALSVRLPSALAASATVILIGYLGFRFHGGLTGICSGLILATAIHFTWLGRIGRMDMTLTFFITCSLACAFLAKQNRQGKGGWVVGTYVFLLLGVFLKGLIALALAVPVLLGLCLVVGEECSQSTWRDRLWKTGVKTLRLPLGLAVVVFLSCLFFLWLEWESQGVFFQEFLGYHHWNRALGNGALRSHPWGFYFYQFPLDFLPWSPLLCFALYQSLKRGLSSCGPMERFGLVWLCAMFTVLSLVSYKRADYLLPAYPGAALFLGGWIGAKQNQWRFLSRSENGWKLAVVATLLVFSISWWGFVDRYLPLLEPHREMKSPARRIREITTEKIWFFNSEMHALAFHCGAPVGSVAGWDALAENARLGSIRYLIVPGKDYNHLQEKLPGCLVRERYSRLENETKGFSRPFVFVELIPDNHVESVHAITTGK